MPNRPHDVSDLFLAPVVLAIDARIEELSRLDVTALAAEVAIDSDLAVRTRSMREDALIVTIQHTVECHGWEFAWDSRGLRLTHGHHSLVLGIPSTFLDYLSMAA